MTGQRRHRAPALCCMKRWRPLSGDPTWLRPAAVAWPRSRAPTRPESGRAGWSAASAGRHHVRAAAGRPAPADAKWRVSAHEGIKGDADRPNVDFSPIISPQDLWRHVPWSAREGLQALTVAQLFGKAKIADHNGVVAAALRVLAGEHQVCRLDVPMDDLHAVKVPQRLQDVGRNLAADVF